MQPRFSNDDGSTEGVGELAPSQFRVLIVNDVGLVRERFSRELGAALAPFDPAIIVVGTQAGAERLLSRYVIDCVMLDFELDTPGGGFEVLRYLHRSHANVDIVTETNYFDETRLKTLVALQRELGGSDVRVVAALNRADLPVDWQALFRELAEKYRKLSVTLRGAEPIAERLYDNRRRLGAGWATPAEAMASLLRVCSAIFGRAGADVFPGQVAVSLELSESVGFVEGKSGALLCVATVHFAQAFGADALEGVRCVLKLGEGSKLQRERDRFSHVVAFGVPLRQRVELLGFTRGQTLSGMCYGFAGGVFGDEVGALAAVGRDLPSAVSYVIADLFDRPGRSWYGHEFSPESLQDYAHRRFRGDPASWFEAVRPRLEKLANRLGARMAAPSQTTAGSLHVGNVALTLPPHNVLGLIPLFGPLPTTLLHGDLHAGNILLETKRDEIAGSSARLMRTCLIDFADAGPGPRLFDAAVLAGELRRLDALWSFPVSRAITDGSIARDIAARTTVEKRILRRMGQAGTAENPALGGEDITKSEPWSELAVLLQEQVCECFGDKVRPTAIEFAACCLVYGLWSLQFEATDAGLVRRLAWVSACFMEVAAAGDDWSPPGLVS